MASTRIMMNKHRWRLLKTHHRTHVMLPLLTYNSPNICILDPCHSIALHTGWAAWWAARKFRIKKCVLQKYSIRNGERDTQRIDRLISHLDWKPAIKLLLENIHFVYMKLSNHNKACQSVIMIISIWVCRSTFVVFQWKMSIWRLRIFYSLNFDKTKP